jgi:hypothetical protein
MQKILTSSLFGLTALMLAIGTAFGHAPGVSITSTDSLQYAEFPQTQTITGTVSHEAEGEGGNVCAIEGLRIAVDSQVLLITGRPAQLFGWDCSQTTADWQVDWVIEEPGIYTVSARAMHDGENTMVTQEVTVTQTGKTKPKPKLPKDKVEVKQEIAGQL